MQQQQAQHTYTQRQVYDGYGQETGGSGLAGVGAGVMAATGYNAQPSGYNAQPAAYVQQQAPRVGGDPYGRQNQAYGNGEGDRQTHKQIGK